MALLDSEGFGFSTNANDFITYNLFSGSVNNGGITTTDTPFGDQALDVGVNTTLSRNTPNMAVGFFGSRFSLYTSGGAPSSGSYIAGFMFADSVANAPQFSVGIDYASGTVRVFSGQPGSSTVLGTSAAGSFTPTPSSSTWFFLEVGWVMGTGASGSIVVRINGLTVLTLTGIATQKTANAWVNQTQMYTQYNSGGGRLVVMHQYWADNSGPPPNNNFLGDVRVQTLLPTSNDSVQFQPNGNAANWQNAAQVPPNPATDYNSDANVGDQDTFNVAPMSTALGTVYGLTVKSLMSASSAGRSGQTVLRSGSSTALGTSTPLSTTNLQLRSVYNTDPATSAGWTKPGVNATKTGYRVSA